jgi:hypothetical protein
MKLRIPYRLVHIALFLLLAFLCYQAHQLVRHLVGAVLCGGFGSVTFTVATTKESCSVPILVTLSGPALTYGLAWLGMFLLRSPKYKLFAYTLIFASFAHLRFIQTLIGQGDELILARQWSGTTSPPLVTLMVFLIGLPPIIAALHTIANRRRFLVFICSWLLPLPLLFVLLVGNQFLFGANTIEMQQPSFLGISLIVLVTDLMASILLIMLAPGFLHPQVEA